MNDSAVVLLSGGQDSTTVFYDALARYERIEALSFDYGQRHRVELELAEHTAARADVPWEVLPVEALKVLGAASLTNPDVGNVTPGAAANTYAEERGLPPSFVPGRNALFFSLAAAFALPRGISTIVTGVCQQDRSGYPDCRSEFVAAMRLALRLGLDAPEFEIDAPLLFRSKAETWAFADALGVLPEIILRTHTCYEGDRSGSPNPWGYGCGECGACTERIRGYDEWRATQKQTAKA